jgi:hypothetical protein
MNRQSFEYHQPTISRFIDCALPVAVALVALFASSRTRAEAGGPPFVTDDPGTPEYHHWEINLAVTAEHRGTERTFEAPLIDVNYGLFSNTELNVEVPYIAQKEDGNRVESLGDIAVGLKWRFYELAEEESAKKSFSLDAVSVYPQIGFPSPNSPAAEDEFVNTHPSFVLPVQLGTHWRQWNIGAEVGCILQSKEHAKFFVGGVVSRTFGHCTLGFELYTTEPNRTSSRVVVADIGAVVSITERYAVLVSIGRELVNRQETRANLVMYVGQQITF